MLAEAEVTRIATHGQAIYDRALKPVLEPVQNGKFVAIDIDTEAYTIAATAEEALLLARQKAPGKVFFLARVGSRAADFHRGLM